ncbi:MAG TPA: SCO family protein [Anaerolineaceae bacterium]|nr:SCO family protein [Anaerolineaceae bacterium]
MKSPRRLGWLWIVGVLGALLVGFVLWFALARPLVVLPRMQLAPGYGLTDASGKLVSSEDQRGVVTVYTFAYSRCEKTCDAIYDALRMLDEELARRQAANDPAGLPFSDPPLRVITLSIDPEYDTPERLNAVGLPFEPKAIEWIWLTGTPERMKSIVGGNFEVFYQTQDDGSLVFGQRLVLVDGAGVVRADLEPPNLSGEKLIAYLDYLYDEIRNSSGAANIAYEAAHFFACYPH